MPKTDNPHSIRLYDSLIKHTDEATAQRIAHGMPLSKSADAKKKFMWAQRVCADLDREMEEAQIKKIRMDCACGPDMGKMNALKKLYQSSGSLEAFVVKANALKQGFELKLEGRCLYLCYPQCYCSCVKRIGQPLSKTWCYCTLGYTKRMFEHIFEREVGVALIDSIKMGGSQCLIQIL